MEDQEYQTDSLVLPVLLAFICLLAVFFMALAWVL